MRHTRILLSVGIWLAACGAPQPGDSAPPASGEETGTRTAALALASWTGWQEVPGAPVASAGYNVTRGGLSAVSFPVNSTNQLYVFRTGGDYNGTHDHNIYVTCNNGDLRFGWAPQWTQVPGQTTDVAPTAVVYNNLLYLFAKGLDGYVYYMTAPATAACPGLPSWSGHWYPVPGSGLGIKGSLSTSVAVSATVWYGTLFLFVVDSYGDITMNANDGIPGHFTGTDSYWMGQNSSSYWLGWSGPTWVADSAPTDQQVGVTTFLGTDGQRVTSSWLSVFWKGKGLTGGIYYENIEPCLVFCGGSEFWQAPHFDYSGVMPGNGLTKAGLNAANSLPPAYGSGGMIYLGELGTDNGIYLNHQNWADASYIFPDPGIPGNWTGYQGVGGTSGNEVLPVFYGPQSNSTLFLFVKGLLDGRVYYNYYD